jgi:hypothetical protein
MGFGTQKHRFVPRLIPGKEVFYTRFKESKRSNPSFEICCCF